MGLAKLCGLLATSVLLLILLVDSTAEGAIPPLQTPCSYSFVIKGTFRKAYKKGGTSNFRITKVFKAPEKLGKKVKVKPGGYCYYPPEDVKVKEYIFVGEMEWDSSGISCKENYMMDPEFPYETKVFQDILNNGC